MLLNKDYHLSYCSNIHPGENWEITFRALRENLPKIKEGLLPNGKFGIGLRLSNLASEELSLGDNLSEFGQWLSENNLYVFTMNGFPYGNFHGEKVKDMVHTPDWTTQDRLQYTLRLFEQLHFLIPEGMDGGISTSPISYKHWHQDEKAVSDALEAGAHHMVTVALKLYTLEQSHGTYLHLDVEPEPDGLLENSEEVLDYFEEYLVPIAKKEFGTLGIDPNSAEKLVKRYITVCYDVCHFSLAYEEPQDTFARFKAKGIYIGKIQISSALKIVSNSNSDTELWKALNAFDEPVYLHQVTERKNDEVKTYSDLSVLLSQKPVFEELRAHFHVPIFLENFGVLHSTQDQIIKTFSYLEKNWGTTKHLEVETYTWEVLPRELKIPLVDSVVRELIWVKKRLQ